MSQGVYNPTGMSDDPHIEKPLDRSKENEMNDTDKIRVTIVVQIDVDREAYEAEYGEQAAVTEIRDHVKGEVVSAAESAFENIDAISLAGWR